MSFDYKNYVSFDLSPQAKAAGEDIAKVGLKSGDRQKMEQALREIGSTPEGQALLKQAASYSPNGKIHITSNPGSFTAAYPGELLLGTRDANARYHSPETGKLHNLSMQHVLVHELQHMALGQKADGMSLSKEADAINATNIYMKKYYNEPYRNPDSRTGSATGGTPGWDIDRNFRRNGYDRRSEVQADNAQVAQGGELNGAKSNINTRIDLGGAWRAAASPDAAPTPQKPDIAPDIAQQPMMARTQAGGMSFGGMG